MEKVDFKKVDKAFYSGKVGRFDLLDVPKMSFLSIKGAGDPNTSPDYTRAIAALYGLSYGLKFHCKKTLEKDHVVPPMEGLWWADDMRDFVVRNKSAWKWQMMIRQPGWVNNAMFAEVLEVVIGKTSKKKAAATDAETLRAVKLGQISEGLSVQTLHVGAYDDEGPVLAEMHEQFIPDNSLEMAGRHHEVYLGDPRKVPPEKLKTLLRQPVIKV
ncbi:MAG: GyrI-like domain-containing protein [Paracoccaceae bacterium]